MSPLAPGVIVEYFEPASHIMIHGIAQGYLFVILFVVGLKDTFWTEFRFISNFFIRHKQ